LKLADTSVLIELLRGNRDVNKALKDDKIAICFPVQYELYRGTKLARNTESGEREVNNLIEELQKLESTNSVAETTSELREKYSEINTFDLMIAAHAVDRATTLLTQDEDFQRIEELDTELL